MISIPRIFSIPQKLEKCFRGMIKDLSGGILVLGGYEPYNANKLPFLNLGSVLTYGADRWRQNNWEDLPYI